MMYTHTYAYNIIHAHVFCVQKTVCSLTIIAVFVYDMNMIVYTSNIHIHVSHILYRYSMCNVFTSHRYDVYDVICICVRIHHMYTHVLCISESHSISSQERKKISLPLPLPPPLPFSRSLNAIALTLHLSHPRISDIPNEKQ